VERRGVALVRCIEAEEVMRWGTDECFQKKLRHKREGGELGLNPNSVPLIPHA
jgi:hypothetical protein